MRGFKNSYNRKKIETILKNNNIDDDIKNIEYLNLNKIIVYFTSNKHILKIFCDNSSVKLGENEYEGYNFINSNYQKFSLPKYECILNKENLFISKIEYLGEKKGNYFDSRNYLNLDYDQIVKNIDAKLYGEKILDKFSNSLNILKINEIKNHINEFLNLNGNLKMHIDSSHGDFVHWNTRFIDNTYYCFDLEHFSKDRVLFYDLIHWYFIPLLQKKYFFRVNSISTFIFKRLFGYLRKNISKRYNIRNLENFNFSIFFYLIEKKLYYLKMLSDEKLVESMTKKYLNQATFLNNEMNKLLSISK